MRVHIKKQTVTSTVVGIISLIISVGIVPVAAQQPLPEETRIVPQAYWEAIEDAKDPSPDAVYRNLTAITEHNTALTWDNSGRVLVATWSTWNGYTQNVGNQLILIQDLWVTVVPDLQDFCKHYISTPEIPLAARLNQLLGLPPETADRASQRQIVEIWVDPQFLFRPSPDPEITDHEAELSFRTVSEFVSVPFSYLHWFYDQYNQRYQVNGQPITYSNLSEKIPYPWTQLGYTYDWGDSADWSTIDPTRPDNVGLSEFVIRQWSPITVHSIELGTRYCQTSPISENKVVP